MDVLPLLGSPKTGSSYSSFTDVSQTDNRSAVLRARRRSGRTGQTRPSRSGTGVAKFLNYATTNTSGRVWQSSPYGEENVRNSLRGLGEVLQRIDPHPALH